MLNIKASNFHTYTISGQPNNPKSFDSCIEDFTNAHPNAFIVDVKLEANKWAFLCMIIYQENI